MSIRLKHGSAADEAAIDTTYKAPRVSVWPQDSLGEYRVAAFSGLTTGIAANGEVFSLRWTDAANLAVLKFVKVRMAVITSFTAAQELAFDAIQATGYSSGPSGGTALAINATNLLKRNNYPQSKVADLRISTTGALTAGSKTLFSNPFLAGVGKTLAAAATVQDAAIEEIFDATNSNDGPIVLQQNEGVIVRNIIALGAGGTVRWSIQMAWQEFLNADYPSL